jgi:PhnB protein
MQVQPYLNFDGRCEEAIELYKSALGAEVETLMRFREGPPNPNLAPENAEKVMHSSMKIGESRVMATDGSCAGKPDFKGISLTITTPSSAEADRLFAALGKDGEVQMPLTETFFSPRFGMVTDRFGVAWMIVAMRENANS